MFNLSTILELAEGYVGKTVILSPDSLAVFYSAYDVLSDLYNWKGYSSGELSKNEIDTIQGVVDGAYKQMMTGVLVGVVVPFVGDITPDNMLLCDGGYYSKDEYPALYSITPPSMKNTEGFYVPDLRERFILSWGISKSPHSIGGQETVVLGVNNIPPHSHNYSPSVSASIDIESAGIPDLTGAMYNPFGGSTDSTGEGEAHDNMPPFYVLKYGVIYE